MKIIIRVVSAILILVVIGGCAHNSAELNVDGAAAKAAVKPEAMPSKGAEGMAGAKGKIEYKPTDHIPNSLSWWKDTDGVAPGVAGCHLGTDEQGELNGRMFGEACLENGLLVESNPGADELHSHKGDLGHPDTFDCDRWCQASGSASGRCEVAEAPPCAASAMCVCNK